MEEQYPTVMDDAVKFDCSNGKWESIRRLKNHICPGCIKRCNLVAHFLAPENLNSDAMNRFFTARMITLNKTSKKTPELDEIRNIAVMSPIVRIIEASCMEELESYINNKMDKKQTGFIKG